MEPRVTIELGAKLEVAALHLRESRFGAEQPIDEAALAGEVLSEPEFEVRGFRLELTGTPRPAGFFVEILGHDRTPLPRRFSASDQPRCARTAVAVRAGRNPT